MLATGSIASHAIASVPIYNYTPPDPPEEGVQVCVHIVESTLPLGVTASTSLPIGITAQTLMPIGVTIIETDC